MTGDDQYRDAIGRQVKTARKLAGLTQQQLAERAHLSLSLVKQVEQTRVPASPAFIAAVARALHIPATQLMGQPYPIDTREDHRIHAVIPDLRRELTAYRLPPEPGITPRPLPELATAVDHASRLRHAATFDTLGAELPALLAELRTATHHHTGHDRERAYGLLAETYYAADQLTSQLGYTDLASIAVDRYEWAATHSSDPLAILIGDYRRAGELINAADWNSALRLLANARAQLEPELGTASPATWSTWGNLHLKSGLAAARAGDADTADAHLAEAQQAATHTGERDDYRLAFGPTNVAIWSVALAVEQRDGTKAITRAHDVHFHPTTPPERIGHHWIDLARGHQLHGNRHKALQALQHARHTSPQQTRYHPQVRETITTLATQDRYRTNTLANLARWAGIHI
ncbi:helix-turn-helix domain-containing protein [Amycolatopsis pigmentata]|uniref:Helix-turn-helix domain-containing protein n=1 Tax=Amycolatopsis pigmentata TaxID=450801 RepID=A0ABW5FRU5_9PSEU